MIRRILFYLILAALILTGCKSKDKNEEYIYQRDPDVAGTVDKLLEKDAPFAALQEILYIDSSREKIYDKAREEFKSTGKYDSLYAAYLEKLYRKDEFHRYIETNENKEVEAKIVGINDTACIILEYRDATRKAFAFKEISYII